MVVESVSYDCVVRGYHVYKSVWEPKERQVLSCLHEENNIYDMFAVKTCLTDENGKDSTLLGICHWNCLDSYNICYIVEQLLPQN